MPDLFLASAQRIIVTGPSNRGGVRDGRASIRPVGRLRRGLGAKVAARNSAVTPTVAPRSRFFTALRFPKESAFEREGFILQASA